ncbi:MAG: hypothetical protein EBT57_09490, partial [Verrucomicrobia bacterium]|nr:hypothetical protein [Verrucomicrobiota bacterium]
MPSTTYSVRAYAINSIGTNYSAAVSFTTMAPNPEFTGLYTQNFNGFTNVSSFPAGWKCTTTSNLNSYAADWLSGSATGGFNGSTNEPGVLGYQHTSGSGTLQNKLFLRNASGGTISNLYVSYLGMVRIAATNQTKFPIWTFTVDDGSGNGAATVDNL